MQTRTVYKVAEGRMGGLVGPPQEVLERLDATWHRMQDERERMRDAVFSDHAGRSPSKIEITQPLDAPDHLIRARIVQDLQDADDTHERESVLRAIADYDTPRIVPKRPRSPTPTIGLVAVFILFLAGVVSPLVGILIDQVSALAFVGVLFTAFAITLRFVQAAIYNDGDDL